MQSANQMTTFINAIVLQHKTSFTIVSWSSEMQQVHLKIYESFEIRSKS